MVLLSYVGLVYTYMFDLTYVLSKLYINKSLCSLLEWSWPSQATVKLKLYNTDTTYKPLIELVYYQSNKSASQTIEHFAGGNSF